MKKMTEKMERMLRDAREANRNRIEYRGQQYRTAHALADMNLGRIYSDPSIRGMWFDATPGTYVNRLPFAPYTETVTVIEDWKV
jgi:hypothetical protein